MAIGASAGGLEALKAVLGSLPGDLGVPVVVVQHLDPTHRSLMAEILARHTQSSVKEAEHGEHLQAGIVYIAVPDRHMLVEPGGVVALTQSELVRFVRPSIDLLFESAAGAFGDGVIAVVLTGTGQDGASGVRVVKEQGGTAIVQDPDTAQFGAMPAAAAATGCADFVLPLDEITPTIVKLVRAGEQA